MIFYFTPGGRLGNQFFQLAAAQGLAAPGERIILSQMRGVLDVVRPGLKVFNLPQKLTPLLDKIMIPLFFKPLIRARLITHIYQKNGGGEIRIRKGLFSRLRYLEGYFQSESDFPAAVTQQWKLKSRWKNAAQHFLAALPCGPKIFVHLRRGDYLTFEVLGKINPTLPIAYYKQAISEVLKEYPQGHLIFLSDDPDFVQREFDFIPSKTVSRNLPQVDFVIMTLCDGAVVANSTLAWWGAYLMRQQKPQALVLAPEFWLGWQSKVWHPRGIRPSFARIVPISPT